MGWSLHWVQFSVPTSHLQQENRWKDYDGGGKKPHQWGSSRWGCLKLRGGQQPAEILAFWLWSFNDLSFCNDRVHFLLLVHKVSQDGSLGGGVRWLPWHNDVVPVGIVDLDVHRSTGGVGNRGRTIYIQSQSKKGQSHQWAHWSLGGRRTVCSQVASPETDTKALCSAVPPLVTMRSV